MDTASLVGVDIETGATIVQILDEAGLKPSVALWAVLAEYGDYRLILSSRDLDDSSLIESNVKVLNALRERNFPSYRMPSFVVLRSKDPFIQELRKLFGKTKSVEGMRLAGQSFGDRFIEDGYVYRIK